jgi:hypothetical protein
MEKSSCRWSSQILDTALKELDGISCSSQNAVASTAQQSAPAINAAFLVRIVITHCFGTFMVVINSKSFSLAFGPTTEVANPALVVLQILILLYGHMMDSRKAKFACPLCCRNLLSSAASH